MIDRKFERPLNGHLAYLRVIVITQPGIGTVSCKPNGEEIPYVDLTRNGEKPQSDSMRRNRTTSSQLFTSFKVQGLSCFAQKRQCYQNWHGKMTRIFVFPTEAEEKHSSRLYVSRGDDLVI